jgi:hypothetical protein
MARFTPRISRFALGLLAAASLALGAGAAQAAMVDAPPAPPESASRPDAVTFPSGGTPTLEVRGGHHIDMRSSPGGDVVATLDDTTEFGSPTVFSVVARRGSWVGVPTELLPNGKLGWLELNEKDLRIDSVGLEIRIDLSDYSAKLLRDGKAERTMPIGIGAPGTDTPTGRFSVTDEIQTGLNPTYGCCLLALSATQPNLPPGWTGGNRMAIHGTSLPLGAANSTGCVHAGEDDLHALIESVPLGTPVIIEK